MIRASTVSMLATLARASREGLKNLTFSGRWCFRRRTSGPRGTSAASDRSLCWLDWGNSMEHPELANVFGRERIDDRQIAEVIGIIHGIIADGQINQAEVEYLRKYLDGRLHITKNPVVRVLGERVEQVLADGILDAEEATDLMETLKSFVGGDFERGEITKASNLPLCAPPPTPMQFRGTLCASPAPSLSGREKTARPPCERLVPTLDRLMPRHAIS